MTEQTISSAIWLALLVPGLPMLSAVFSLFFKEKFGWIVPIISNILLLIASICAVVLFVKVIDQEVFSHNWNWLTINGKHVNAGVLLDRNASAMALIVTLISFLVHLYSLGYMAEDKAPARYFGMLGFFTAAMLGLVMSSNLLITFICWELVGFSSYRLIGHWQEKPAAARAASKAFIVNRIGDLGFLIALMILWSMFGNLNIAEFNFSNASPGLLTAAGVCIFIGVIGKSAQLPLFHWLPDAMEGPTPVSALIHAATMVAAGVFLLIRVSPLFTQDSLMIVAITGAATAVIGAWGALSQFDIKKILAYSTISQLGLMVMAIGAGAAEGGYLHLLHHAFFKAGLFLGAGSIIHAMHNAAHHHESFDVQDIRNMGGLRKQMPITFWSFVICGAALAGLPFTSGFVSKELILTQMHVWAAQGSGWQLIIIACAWAVTLLTPIYTFRMIWYAFFTQHRHSLKIEEVPPVMRPSMIILSIGALAFFISFEHIELYSPLNILLNLHLPSSHLITVISLVTIAGSVFFAWKKYQHADIAKSPIVQSPQFYLDQLSAKATSFTQRISGLTLQVDRKLIDKILHGVAYMQVAFAHMVGWSDKYLVDGFVNGVAYSAKGLGSVARVMVNGKIQSYLLWAIAALLIFILWILY